ncbi:MAG: hypothetical protein COW84_03740 [Gammaproteobacteria bacterium CG22_combo_CG10-13_8_21_14_all_40_8]|nr:MAG: hypothetical protein COW84_03740 [Gammaproteobacteria bacterium CG22_combo_CG10-13_8_21_14_all_40_8]
MIFNTKLRAFVLYKVSTSLRSEASTYYLSYLWWIVEPILIMLMFYFVFVVLLRGRSENYNVFLLTGIVPMQWFQKSVSGSMTSITQNKGLILQVYIDKRVFPTITVLVDSFKQQFSFLALFALLFLNGHYVSILWLQLFALFITQMVWIFSIAFLVAAVVPLLPDLKFLVSIGLQGMFFVSGVFFSYTEIPVEYQQIFLLNPMAFLLKSYRDILIEGISVDWHHLGALFLISLILLFIGSSLIKKLDHQYPRMLS